MARRTWEWHLFSVSSTRLWFEGKSYRLKGRIQLASVETLEPGKPAARKSAAPKLQIMVLDSIPYMAYAVSTGRNKKAPE